MGNRSFSRSLKFSIFFLKFLSSASELLLDYSISFIPSRASLSIPFFMRDILTALSFSFSACLILWSSILMCSSSSLISSFSSYASIDCLILFNCPSTACSLDSKRCLAASSSATFSLSDSIYRFICERVYATIDNNISTPHEYLYQVTEKSAQEKEASVRFSNPQTIARN